MQDPELRELAANLAMARRKGELLPNPVAWAGDVDEAYRLQELTTAAYRETACGWKVGATNDKALAAMQLDKPFFGPMFQANSVQSGSTIAFAPGTKGIECEIAFRLKNDLPAKPEGHSLEAVKAAIGSVHPAMEVVGARIDGPGPGNGLQPIADFGGNVAFIYGAEVTNWNGLDLAAETVTCFKNGEQAASGEGSIVLGNPLNSLVWLTEQGIALNADEFISTGTLTGLTPAEPGDSFEATFANLGKVAITFAS